MNGPKPTHKDCLKDGLVPTEGTATRVDEDRPPEPTPAALPKGPASNALAALGATATPQENDALKAQIAQLEQQLWDSFDHGGFTTELCDQSDELAWSEKRIKVVVSTSNGSIFIAPEGYGDRCSRTGSGIPLMVDLLDGDVRVVAWADIKIEDPTHEIRLSGALESNRNTSREGVSNPSQMTLEEEKSTLKIRLGRLKPGDGDQIAVIRLSDQCGELERPDVQVHVLARNGAIGITPEGHGDACSIPGGGVPILVELYEGDLRVLVWADITQEDPTHTISLKGALESEAEPELEA